MSSRKWHVPKQGAHHGVVELFLDVFPLGISADRQIATVFYRFVDARTHLPDLYMRVGLEALDDGLAWLRTERVLIRHRQSGTRPMNGILARASSGEPLRCMNRRTWSLLRINESSPVSQLRKITQKKKGPLAGASGS
jgi:hypothetical protein